MHEYQILLHIKKSQAGALECAWEIAAKPAKFSECRREENYSLPADCPITIMDSYRC